VVERLADGVYGTVVAVDVSEASGVSGGGVGGEQSHSEINSQL
jgi:hypothetical protein